MGDLPIGTNWQALSWAPASFYPFSLDLLPEGYDPCYDALHERNGQENRSQIQWKNSDKGKQNHEGDNEECIQNSNRTQSQDKESYMPR